MRMVGNTESVRVVDLCRVLPRHLSAAQADWLTEARAEAAAEPATVKANSAQAGRRCGRGPLGGEGSPVVAWTVDDAVRALLLAATRLAGPALAALAATVYQEGDAAERRGVLRALGALPVGDAAGHLNADALRTRDTRLVAAALGPYGARRLAPPAYRHGVLGCLHLGIPLTAVAGLDLRADPELGRMARDFVDERLCAGHPVPGDAWILVRDCPSPPGGADPRSPAVRNPEEPCASSTRTSI